MLIDGHLRAETTPYALVPVLVLDVNEEEADKIFALTLDPLAAMAESDAERLKALLTTVCTDSEAVQDLLKAPRWTEAVGSHPSRGNRRGRGLTRASPRSLGEMGHRVGPDLAGRATPNHLRRLHQWRRCRTPD